MYTREAKGRTRGGGGGEGDGWKSENAMKKRRWDMKRLIERIREVAYT